MVLTPHQHTPVQTHAHTDTNDEITLETSCSSAPGLTMPNGLLLFRLHTLERFKSVQRTHYTNTVGVVVGKGKEIRCQVFAFSVDNTFARYQATPVAPQPVRWWAVGTEESTKYGAA